MKKIVIGIDLGGTNTAFGLVDQTGKLLDKASIKTTDYPYVKDYEDRYVKDLCEAMHKLYDKYKAEYTLIGIGIGAPNANCHKGTIEHPANLWKFGPDDSNPDESRRIFPFAKQMSDCFGGAKAVITNDANAAAIGEMVYGGAKGMQDFIEITLGTGVGSGFVANGELISGHDGFAGEFGHVIVDRNSDRVCGCGRKGCLETYASATGIRRTALELLHKSDEASLMREIPKKDFESLHISQAALKGDKLALEVFRYTGEILGRTLADAVAITSPQAIFIFGGLAKAGDLILGPTKKYMEENMLFVFKNKVKILPSEVDDDKAAILGAAALIWQTEKA